MAEREVVAVTGASGGVGRAIAREFAKHGASVGLIARGRAGLDATAQEVCALGATPYVHQADVAEYDQLRTAAAAIEGRLGPIDVWVNNAMTTVFAFIDDGAPHEFERATRQSPISAYSPIGGYESCVTGAGYPDRAADPTPADTTTTPKSRSALVASSDSR